MMQLKLQFQSSKKESMSITAYFSKMKELSDSLVLAGLSLTDDEFVMQLLAGLPFDYDAVVANINS